MNPTRAQNTRRWMLVDDDETILLFIREIVAQFGGIETQCFTSPQKALAAYTAHPKAFELVISDLDMPGMNGIEFCHHLLKLNADAKVLLSTGSIDITEKNAVLEGFSGMLHKPVRFSEVRSLLDDMGIENFTHPKHPE